MKTKMKLMTSVKIWLAIYPSITLFLFLFGKALNRMALYERALILTIVLVPWIVFVGMPIVDFFLRNLNKKRKP